MKRSQIVKLPYASALFVAVAISFLFLWVCQQLVIHDELEHLEMLNDQIIERTNTTYDNAVVILHGLVKSETPRCSDAQIMAMRKLQSDSIYIAEVGFFENGLLKCSAWGRPAKKVPQTRPNFITADGIGVILNLRPQMSGSGPKISLALDDASVLVHPDVLLNGLMDPSNRIAVATEDGKILASHNGPDAGLVRSLIANPRKGINDDVIFAANRREGFIAVSVRPRHLIYAPFQRQAATLAPFFALVLLLLIGGIVRMTKRRLSLLGELKAAVRRRELTAAYQPIVDLRTGECVGAEALVRWISDGRQISPDVFIPLAEENDLIGPITNLVIDHVFADLRFLLENSPECHVTVNLAAADIRTMQVLTYLTERLAETSIQPQQVWLELTERGFVEIDLALTTLQYARELGHMVAIDDFGTGYSSLRSLQDLPVDALKIDKCFVDLIGHETARSAVAPLIIEMANHLDLTCIAEGIETRQQLDYLTSHGVKYGQGWLFSRALTAGEFIAYYNRVPAGR